MLNINSCKSILNKYDYDLRDEEIERIRDFLSMIALSQSANNKLNNPNCYEKGDTVLQS